MSEMRLIRREASKHLQCWLNWWDLVGWVDLLEANLPVTIHQEDGAVGHPLWAQHPVLKRHVSMGPEVAADGEGSPCLCCPGNTAIHVVGADGYGLSTQPVNLAQVPLN